MLASSFAIGQDISVSNLTPLGGQTLKSNVDQPITVSMKAETLIPLGTQITIEYSWDDGEFVQAGGTLNFSGDVPAGTTVNSQGIRIKTPDLVGDTAKLTVKVVYAADTKPSNNTAIRLYYINDILPYDLKVELTGPEKYATIKTWSTVNFESTITNVGSEDLPTGTPLIYSIVVNNQTQGNPAVYNYTGPTLKTNESAKVNLPLNLSKNASTGTLTFCLLYLYSKQVGSNVTSLETYATDNLGCTDLIVVINSVNDDFLELSSMNYNNGKLNLNIFNKETVSDYNFVVTSVTGQQIANVQHFIPTNSYSNESIALDGAASGVYILNIFADGQIVGTEKFMVR